MIKHLLYYLSDSHDPYENLAIEYALTMHVPPDTCILFLWQNENTVVIGRNQNCWKECYVNLIEAEGGKIARRFSGGGAVYHDLGNLNFSFCTRSGDDDPDRQTAVLLDAVHAFGIAARQNGRNDMTVESENITDSSRGSIYRKFSGSAFFEKDDFVCHHGTLMVSSDLEKLSRYLNVSRDKLLSKSIASVKSRVINLGELCPNMTVMRMKMQMIASFEKIYGTSAAAVSDDQIDQAMVCGCAAKLSSWSWIFGRKMVFTHQMHQRYAWGEIDFAFKVKNGMIEDISIHTDAMETAFILRCADALKGCRYTCADMEKRLMQCAAKHQVLMNRVHDMAALFKANL